MPKTTKITELGFRQARALCGMNAKRRLEFIAEGLPIIAQSARSLMEASKRLNDFPREAEVLEGHAVEESAKALILIDIVRCPPKLVSSRCGPMMDWYYDHQSRLIYAEAQRWIAYSPTDLAGYVDSNRQTYTLEGGMSEYIVPTWEIFKREATLYADAIGNEDDEPSWHSPLSMVPLQPDEHRFLKIDPYAYGVIDALDALGAFSPAGVKIVHEVWGARDFSTDLAAWEETNDLTYDMMKKLLEAGLCSDRAEDHHTQTLYHRWQKPMYFADFSPIKVTLEEMQKLRDARFWSEVGY